MSADRAQRTRLVAWVVVAFLAVGFAWQARAAYWQCDDAYISYRYAWNLLQGNGLVFNVGERVEGYTNFAWVLELALVWKLFGLAPETASIVLSTIATGVALACVWQLARTGPWPERRVRVGLCALLVLCTSRTWAAWTTSGLETRQFTSLVLLGVVLLTGARGRVRHFVLASLAFAAAELTRPEALMLWMCAAAWLVLEMLIERRFAWRPVIAFVAPCALVVGAHYLWRHAYYGDWLPNTYYAKHVRPWPESGLPYLVASLIETGAWLSIPLAVVGGIARALRKDRTHVLTAFLLVPHAAYLVRIGGDAFEMRPFDLWWPLLAPASVEGVFAIAALAARVVRPGAGPSTPEQNAATARSRSRVSTVVASVSMLLLLAYGSAIQIAKAELTQRSDTRAASIKLRGSVAVADAPWLRVLPGMSGLLEDFAALREENAPHCVGTLWRVQEVLWRDELVQWEPYARATERPRLPPDAVFPRISIGIVGWCLPELVILDLVGLTDRVIAHTPCKRPNHKRILAHDRAADPAYLKARNINFYVRPAARSQAEALAAAGYALRCGADVWMPFDSPDRDWVTRAFAAHEVWAWSTASRIGFFEDGVRGWTLAGAAFADNPRTGLPYSRAFFLARRTSADVGLFTRASDGSGRGQGLARSAPFVAQAGTRFEVRLAATSANGCGVRLVAENETLKVLTSVEPGMLGPQQVDLDPFAGRTLQVEVFDESETEWIIVADLAVVAPRRLE